MRKIANSIEYVSNNGILAFVKECYFRLEEAFLERYYGVNTAGSITKEKLGYTGDSLNYISIPYGHIVKMLNHLPLKKSNSVLLEYGCGKGRAVVCAAAYNYKKIIGIELSDFLITMGKDNIDKMKHRKTKSIELLQCDAQDYVVPPEVNIIYFYNPFIGSILKKVAENIFSSYKKSPRKIYVIFFNNDHFDNTIKNQNWLTKIDQSEFHLETSCGLYETLPENLLK